MWKFIILTVKKNFKKSTCLTRKFSRKINFVDTLSVNFFCLQIILVSSIEKLPRILKKSFTIWEVSVYCIKKYIIQHV